MAGINFQRVANANPERNAFDLSYEKKFTCDMGELIPVMCDEMVPGDTFVISNELVARLQPLVAPVLHEINIFVHYFFVHYRLLWTSWEDFITGGTLGNDASTLPTWDVTDQAVGSLWDYLGFPTGITLPANNRPVDFPKRAYNLIYNEFYRDETQIAELTVATAEAIQIRAWEKDYFTSALPWQQRGTAPALPISGTIAATGQNVDIEVESTGDPGDHRTWVSQNAGASIALSSAWSEASPLRWVVPGLETNLAGATTFDIADLRLATKLQLWMERNARGGVRYNEFLKTHYNEDLEDYKATRPVYIGGTRQPLIVSEVAQTSGGADDAAATPQGTLAGHGLSADRQFVCKFHANEFGLVMGIMSIMPKPAYSQGVNRQWIKSTRYDYFAPEFADLSEQPVTRMELYATAVENDNETVFGYQGRYDEMRVKHDQVCGDMRATFNYWHLGREFAAAPELNQTFIECVPRKDIFAVADEDGVIVNIRNIVKAIRPLPLLADPGRSLHF